MTSLLEDDISELNTSTPSISLRTSSLSIDPEPFGPELMVEGPVERINSFPPEKAGFLEICYNHSRMPDIFINSEAQPQKLGQDLKTTKTKKKRLQEKSSNPLTSFSYMPTNVSFETKDTDERIVLLIRQHPIIFLPRIVITALAILAPSFFGLFSPFLSLPFGFQIVTVLIWYLFVFSSTLEAFLGWFFNVYFVTDHRVIDMDFVSLMHKEVTDANIGHIEDVTYKMGGLTKSVFNYGDIFIQTAGEDNNLDFLSVPMPARVAKILQDLIEKNETGSSGSG